MIKPPDPPFAMTADDLHDVDEARRRTGWADKIDRLICHAQRSALLDHLRAMAKWSKTGGCGVWCDGSEAGHGHAPNCPVQALEVLR